MTEFHKHAWISTFSAHCGVQHWFWVSNHLLILQMKVVRLIVYFVHKLLGGRLTGRLGDAFAPFACSHLTSFNMWHIAITGLTSQRMCWPCVGIQWALALICDAKEALSEGKNGPVETGLTGPASMALNVFVHAGRILPVSKKGFGLSKFIVSQALLHQMQQKSQLVQVSNYAGANQLLSCMTCTFFYSCLCFPGDFPNWLEPPTSKVGKVFLRNNDFTYQYLNEASLFRFLSCMHSCEKASKLELFCSLLGMSKEYVTLTAWTYQFYSNTAIKRTALTAANCSRPPGPETTAGHGVVQ